jgi:hypothetical protein
MIAGRRSQRPARCQTGKPAMGMKICECSPPSGQAAAIQFVVDY